LGPQGVHHGLETLILPLQWLLVELCGRAVDLERILIPEREDRPLRVSDQVAVHEGLSVSYCHLSDSTDAQKGGNLSS